MTSGSFQTILLAAKFEAITQYVDSQQYDMDLINNFLLSAAEAGHLKCVIYLCVMFNNYYLDLGKAFIIAIQNGHLAVVKYLVCVDTTLVPDYGNPLCLACRYGKLAIVEYILSHSGVGNADWTMRAFRTAVEAGRADIVSYFLNNSQVEVDITREDRDVMSCAVKYGYLSIVKALYQAGYSFQHIDSDQIPDARLREYIQGQKYLESVPDLTRYAAYIYCQTYHQAPDPESVPENITHILRSIYYDRYVN